MLFSDNLIKTYIYVVAISHLIDVFTTPYTVNRKKVDTKQEPVINNVKVRIKPCDTVRLVVQLAVIILALIFILKYQVQPIIIIISMFSAIIWIVILPYLVWNFFQYVFLKPLDFELTKDRENVLELMGIVMLFFCGFVARDDVVEKLYQLLSSVKPVVKDLLLMVIFTFWYFTVLFFICSFIILSVHRIVVLINSKINFKNKTTPKRNFKKQVRAISIAQQVTNLIEALTQEEKLKKACFYLLWFICVVVDVFIDFLLFMIRYLLDVGTIIWFDVPKLFRDGFKRFSNAFGRNQGKSIIIVSRVLFVGSLLLVYFIDKYTELFSVPGSEVYEFMCSVIIIPFLITQIIALRSKKKSVASAISIED